MNAPGALKALSTALAASLLGALAFQSTAWAGLSVVKGEAAGAVRVIVTNPGDNACGAEINFGNGRTERKRLEPKEQWPVDHGYGADGNFTVTLTGVPVIRGLRSVGACELQQQVAVTVAGGQATAAAAASPGAPAAASAGAAPATQRPGAAQAQSAAAPSPGESADLVLFYRKSSNQLRFVTAIDGTRKLDSADRLTSNGYQLCYILQPDAYRGLGGPEAQRLLDGEVGRVMNSLAGNRQVRSTNVDCIRGGQFVGASFADVVAVQRRVMPDLAAIRDFQQGFEQFAEVKYDVLAQVVARRQQAVAQRAQDLATWTAEIDTLAASGSTDKVGSITLSFPEGERAGIKACTLEYSGVQGQAVIAYGNGLISYLSPAYRTRASEAQATFNANQPYSSVYKTMDDFYVDLQKDPRKCNVFVDFPKNLKTLLTALGRDRRATSAEVNNLMPVPELREAWAKRQGFESLAASEFATQIRANAAGLKSLADKGIRDKAAFDRATEEMRAAKYGEGTAVSDVLAYLEDKAAAAEKRGSTAVTIRDERVRAQRAEAERRGQEEQRRRAEYAKEFPFTATISCGMNERHINIMACMSGRGSLKSQLELSNGSQYKMYQPWEVTQAGRETSEGVVIPLRSDFKLTIQNVDDTLILSVKIVANATNRVVFNKSASRFGTIIAN